MNISFIIQARLGSTRLPGKILLPFYNGQSILDLLIEKLKKISPNIIVATSVSKENDKLEQIAKEKNIFIYRGSENDVLLRFIATADKYGVQHIIRICSDNPFLELASIQKLIDCVTSDENDTDYVSFDVNGIPSIKTHYGFWTEYVSLKALKRIDQMTDEPIYHEHVTNYIYTHPEYFKIKWLPGPLVLEKRNDIRLTIDTESDFKSAQTIYTNLCRINPYPTIDEIVSYLDLHPYHFQSMREQINKNTK